MTTGSRGLILINDQPPSQLSLRSSHNVCGTKSRRKRGSFFDYSRESASFSEVPAVGTRIIHLPTCMKVDAL